MRIWRNRQTRMVQVHVSIALMQVQLLLSAPQKARFYRAFCIFRGKIIVGRRVTYAPFLLSYSHKCYMVLLYIMTDISSHNIVRLPIFFVNCTLVFRFMKRLFSLNQKIWQTDSCVSYLPAFCFFIPLSFFDAWGRGNCC